MNLLGGLQRLGRSLQLPIATLPVAALLLRLGQPDVFNLPFIAEAGGAIFGQLALIFAIGVAVGWSKDDAGAAALAGAVGYLILTKAMVVINKDVNMGVLAGILSGLIAGVMYNRFHAIKLPDWLAFFGGKRFVPIITGLTMLILAAILGYVWPPIQNVIKEAGDWMVNAHALGAAVFATVNRLLIPTGLHQVINSIAWFQIGDFNVMKDGVQVMKDGQPVIAHGDLNRFFAGDVTAGQFMAGFYPVMMFGLPGAALAMYFAAPKNRRAAVGGLLFSVAFTAFLTGVTEPLEFLFMFLAPVLYAVHAVLTGVSAYIATMLDVHAGFSFSAGAIDFVLMSKLPAAKNVSILLIMGVIWFVAYYALFTFFIKAFNLKTPGREDDAPIAGGAAPAPAVSGDMASLASSYIAVVGGAANLTGIDACITRLRLQVNDSSIVNEAEAKRLGASGLIRLNKQNVQIIVGPKAEMIADGMRRQVGAPAPVAAAPAPAPKPAAAAPAPAAAPVAPVAVPTSSKGLVLVAPLTGNIVPLEQVPDAAFASKAVGEGIAIQPTGKFVVAPASGTLVKIFNSNHAFALVADSGAEIIVHIGIETVKLGGQGFTRLAEQGAHVNAGDPVLELDLEYLAANAQSLISPVVISNSDQFSGLADLASGSVEAGKSALYTVVNK
ncbi:PTS system N-acetylglucosamine-specific IIC component [Silvimonas terrae]|uniref:PTS system N-acetylglucosamine-specific IIC component n=1 Tax=Silvimonas terrae TaxID=300266 RepID=A0A840RCF5_9NEIS|nr:N-acetylglucosamine-specific PTS transporter subunit IIBC [Silvimonas terrae]MBB5190254.1 PTS system N-acetylglucosamine-specific IIC component [Silvimonas terrae]